MNSKRLQRGSGALCLKYILIVTNCVFVILAAAVVGVVVFLCIDQIGFIKGVLGTDLVVASAGLIIGSGCLLFIFSIFGIIAAALEHTTLLAIYFSFMIVLFCTFICGAICVAVYKTQLSDQVKLDMENNLRKYYGVNLDNHWNRQVTNSWDQAQSTWKCCSVGDQSWAIYRQSEWYKIQPGVPGVSKPYVPSSCCVTDENGHISDANLKECQTKQDGPPGTDLGSQYAGNVNPSLFYRGCYEAAKNYMQNNQLSWYTVMIGIGIGLAILMLIGLFLSIGLCCSLMSERRIRRERSTIMMSTYQQQNSKQDPSYYMYSVA